jgi:hypothetical protein
MASVVKVVEVRVPTSSSTFNADLGTELTSEIQALGAPFTTSFNIVHIWFEKGGRATLPTVMGGTDYQTGEPISDEMVQDVQTVPTVRVKAIVEA